MRKEPIVFIFTSPLDSGCDYVRQTLRIASRSHPVYAIALGDIISFPKYLVHGDHRIVFRFEGARVIRPISILPAVRFRWVRNITYWITACILRWYLARKFPHAKKIVWFFEPYHMPTLLRVFSGYITVFDCVDYFPAFSSYAAACFQKIIHSVDIVTANSTVLMKKMCEIRPDVALVPLGFAKDIFPARSRRIRKKSHSLMVGFVGGISMRIDFALLERVVKALPSVTFVLVGHVEPNVFGKKDALMEHVTRLRTYHNIRILPGVPKNHISTILRSFDIGMIPYDIRHAYNRYCFPMKVMEYFYAGLPIVSTDIEELRRYKKYVHIIHSSSDAVQYIKEFIQNPMKKSYKRETQRIALKNEWMRKMAMIMTMVDSVASVT